MLALPFSDTSMPENGSEVISEFSLNKDFQRRIEPAGHFFYQFYKEKIINYNESATKQQQAPEEESKGEEFTNEQINDFEKKRHKKQVNDLKKQFEEENYYNILELGELGMGASENEIKKAYRKMALVYHPDKHDGPQSEDKKAMWLKIQKAYETLTDPEKKKKYDSTLPFDDSIPEESEIDSAKFYDIFKPLFIKNAFWSTKKPVPEIGDAGTDIKKVYKFYDFWEKFDSWRDFSVYDEYNLEEAENRYERRYMEKENAKLKAPHIKKEKARIKKLVDLAEKLDPRLIKIRQQEEEERERIKQEKLLKKEQFKKEKEEKEKREEEAKLAKQKQIEDEEKSKKDEEKKKKDDQRKAIKDLKTTFAEKVDSAEYDRFWLESQIEKMKNEDMIKLKETLDGVSKKDGVETLKKFMVDFEKVIADRRKQNIKEDKERTKQSQEESKRIKDEKWAVEELSLLAKAVTKFPSGYKNRWVVIAAFVGTKTSEECIQKAKELGQAESLKATSSQVSKEAFSQLQKQAKTMKVIDAEPDKRIVFDQINSKLIENQEETKIGDKATTPTTKPKPEAKPEAKDTKETKDSKETKVEAAPEKEEWTQEQQQALEKALKDVPATLDAKERWQQIAERVPGKTKKQCVDRYKELRDAVVKAKAGK